MGLEQLRIRMKMFTLSCLFVWENETRQTKIFECHVSQITSQSRQYTIRASVVDQPTVVVLKVE